MDRILDAIDRFQRTHRAIGFPYAVFKQYSEEHGGYKSALVTYYGFLSLFPLLIVFTSLTQLVLKDNDALRARVSDSVTAYFPLLGSQLEQAMHSPRQTGVALAVSLLISVFAARGGASALQHTLSDMWHIPEFKNPGFFQHMARSFGIIVGGGLGLLTTTFLAGYLALLGRSAAVHVGVFVVSVLLLWATFIWVFRLAIATNKSIQDVALGALIAAVGIQVVQTLGTILLAHQLDNLDNAYGTFAAVLGILYWIYLQAQVILYSAEIDIVRRRAYYPRSIRGELTDADKRALRRQAKSHQKNEAEDISVSFS